MKLLEVLRKNARKDGFAAAILATPDTIIGAAANKPLEFKNRYRRLWPLLRDYTFGCESEGVDTPYKEALEKYLEEGKIPEPYVKVYMGKHVVVE